MMKQKGGKLKIILERYGEDGTPIITPFYVDENKYKKILKLVFDKQENPEEILQIKRELLKTRMIATEMKKITLKYLEDIEKIRSVYK